MNMFVFLLLCVGVAFNLYLAFSPNSMPTEAGAGLIFAVLGIGFIFYWLYDNYKKRGKLII